MMKQTTFSSLFIIRQKCGISALQDLICFLPPVSSLCACLKQKMTDRVLRFQNMEGGGKIMHHDKYMEEEKKGNKKKLVDDDGTGGEPSSGVMRTCARGTGFT